MMRNLLLSAVAVIIAAIPSIALEAGTMDAVRAAVAIGAAISGGEIDPGLASDVVRSLQKDKVPNSEIGSLFQALLDTEGVRGEGVRRVDGPGMGPFVQEMHRRGLRGRALAQAIHEEKARRGIPGHSVSGSSGVIVVPVPDDDDERGNGNRNRRKMPPGHANR